MLFTQVDPNGFIDTDRSLPANGRGAWNRNGIGFDYRYAINPDGQPRIGSQADKSMAHWAVAAGCYIIQSRLITLGHMGPLSDGEKGLFGERTLAGVKAFQAVNKDPDGGAQLVTDGTVGRSDARALFTPILNAAERKYDIPNHYLRGECNHESMLDPGAVGYYIYYPDYRGVDRGAFQINSKSAPDVTWAQAFDATFAADWSAKRMRTNHDTYAARWPNQDDTVLWHAAILSHNNPSAAAIMARTGYPPYETSAAYINNVLLAIY